MFSYASGGVFGKRYLHKKFCVLTEAALYGIVSRVCSRIHVEDCPEFLLSRHLTIFLSLAALFVLSACPLCAQSVYPRPQGRAVNDFAGVIDAENARKIEILAAEMWHKTSTAIVVVTVSAIGENSDINQYVNGLYSAWGIGKKGEDKGLLIFLSVGDRQIRIETGYGVEGILPDGRVGEILDAHVVPYLKTGETGKGLYNAALVCAAYIAKDAGVDLTGVSPLYRSSSRPAKQGFNLLGLIFFLLAAVVLLGTKQGRRMLPWILLLLATSGSRGGGGGGFGGGFGGFGGGMSGGGGAGRSF